MSEKKLTDQPHDNASDETSTSGTQPYKSPFEPQHDILSNKTIIEINKRTTKINDRKDPEFLRDVCPYFAPLICNMICMLTIIFTGKPLLGGWLMFIGTPIYNTFLYQDVENISRINEKTWMRSKMFFIPLYAYIGF